MRRAGFFRSMSFLGLVVGCFYYFVFYLASHGDAFNGFFIWAKNSSVLMQEFGKVDHVSLKLLGGYQEKMQGDTGSAKFIVLVEGAKSSDELNVEMIFKNGTWLVNRVDKRQGGKIFEAQ